MFGAARFCVQLTVGLALLLPVAAKAQAFQTLFVFPSGSQSDPAPGGAGPVAGLIKEGKFLYGTTSVGGNVSNALYRCGISSGCGTAFRINTVTGKQTTIYKFCRAQPNCKDGGHPLAGLTFNDGVFYGTTEGGGMKAGTYGGGGAGTIYKLTPPASGHGRWTETVLHAFCKVEPCADGNNPSSLLVFGPDGDLYGTTADGAPEGGYGTVFKLDPATGDLTTLYTFSGGADGDTPVAGVVFGKDGALYGTTQYGGSAFSGDGNGTVYRLDPVSQTLTTIVTFPTADNNGTPYWPLGKNPVAGLVVDKKGNLYGTTQFGGAVDSTGDGTAFKLTPPGHGVTVWTETVLHSFSTAADSSDGGNPNGPLVFDKSGLLYGTTMRYGAGSGPIYPWGTVFELDPNSQALTALYAFPGTLEGTCPDDCFGAYPNGDQPAAGLAIDFPAGGGVVLYGTTQGGGSTTEDSCYDYYDYDGCGTVFVLTP